MAINSCDLVIMRLANIFQGRQLHKQRANIFQGRQLHKQRANIFPGKAASQKRVPIFSWEDSIVPDVPGKTASCQMFLGRQHRARCFWECRFLRVQVKGPGHPTLYGCGLQLDNPVIESVSRHGFIHTGYRY
ncbi:hypothetical protein BsWGS_02522 [Bradybaena similaris]